MALRQEKLNELIRHQLGEIIIKELEFPDQCLVAITRVETSPDNKYCKIFVSVIPDHFRGSALKVLTQNTHHLYKLLHKQLKTKFTPNLRFLIDEGEIYASEIDRLLDEVK